MLATAQFVVVLDASIVNVALPVIGRQLQFGRENLSWIVNGYTLAFAGFLLAAGRVGDAFGRRATFLAGLLLFGVASLACGLAATDDELIVFSRDPWSGCGFPLPRRACARDLDLLARS